MSKRNLGSVFLGDRVQHLPHHLAHIPMSPPPNSGDDTLAPPTEESLDGHTDEVASQAPEESEGAAEEEKQETGEEGVEVEVPAATDEQGEPDTAKLDLGDATTNLDTLLTSNPVSVSPELMLELRLRWLEALVLGIGKDGTVAPPREQDMTGGTLMRKANEAQRALDDAVKANDGLRKFMGVYNQNAHLLTPAFAHGLVPASEAVSVSDLEALVFESEADIRAADRDLREIAELEARGVLDAGKLPSHEPLKPRVEALVQAHLEDLAKFESLEARIANLITTYSSHVNGLSELFVAWDKALNEAEATVTKLEKEHKKAKETSFD